MGENVFSMAGQKGREVLKSGRRSTGLIILHFSGHPAHITNTQIHKYIGLIISFTHFNLVTIISIVIIIDGKSGDLEIRFPPFLAKFGKVNLFARIDGFRLNLAKKLNFGLHKIRKNTPGKFGITLRNSEENHVFQLCIGADMTK